MSSTHLRPLRCLWLAREVPFPSNTGDRIYSGELAVALAQSGTEVSFLGLRPPDASLPPAHSNIRWLFVDGVRRSNLRSLFSWYPLVSAAHNTPAMREALRDQLAHRWDVVILDHYSSAWAVSAVEEHVRRSGHKVSVVHVSHNYETELARALFVASLQRIPRALILLQNYLKIFFWERRILHSVNICTSITAEDSESFRRIAPKTKLLILTPGYSGRSALERQITCATPRSVVLIGSFRWAVKELNLRQLIELADAQFAEAGITLDVIGDVPENLRKEYEGRLRACQFHGFVEDYTPYLTRSRLALVPEIVGGGFKLKFLDYIFGRVPIATISHASAGLSAEIRSRFILADDMKDLVAKVVASIDNFDLLNEMQVEAYKAARSRFHWADRGIALQGSVQSPKVSKSR